MPVTGNWLEEMAPILVTISMTVIKFVDGKIVITSGSKDKFHG